jgi:hypothetical protein
MSNAAISGPLKRSGLAWSLLGLVFGLVTLYAARGAGLPIGPFVKPAVGLFLVCAGLATLVPLAAFGTKTAEQRANRVRASALGAAQIILGTAQLIPDSRVSIPTLLVAFLLTVAALLRVPRGLFAPGA